MYCGPQLSYVHCALSILVSHYLIARAALHWVSGRFAEPGLQFQEVSLQPNESQHDGMSLDVDDDRTQEARFQCHRSQSHVTQDSQDPASSRTSTVRPCPQKNHIPSREALAESSFCDQHVFHVFRGVGLRVGPSSTVHIFYFPPQCVSWCGSIIHA